MAAAAAAAGGGGGGQKWWCRGQGKKMDMASRRELVDTLRRYRETLRWETDLLRTEVESRGLQTLSGKKDYLKKHSEGRSLVPESELDEQLSVHKVVSLPLVTLPYLVAHYDEALGLLLHEAHKLVYRIKSLRELGAPIPLEKLRLLSLVSHRCEEISRSIRMYRSRKSSNSSQDALFSVYKQRRISWESIWGCPMLRCGGFNDITTLSPMYFTHGVPGIKRYPGSATQALQIYSFKIHDLSGNLNWPLRVYGVVAARDEVDGNRNLLFSRSRENCQVLTEKDPFLHLSGPSRAIMSVEPVDFEVELRIKDGTESQDKALITAANHYGQPADYALFCGCQCSAELSLQTVYEAVQATILSVRIVGGGSPFKSGVQVACSPSTKGVIAATCRQVVLLDSVENFPEDGLDGYLPLSRNVVSVESKGSLRVIIKAYTESHLVAHEAQLDFPAQRCQISQVEDVIGEHKVVVSIAWSLLVRDKFAIMAAGFVLP